MGILETTLVPSVGAGGPTRADHCDEGVALTDVLSQDVNEIFSKFDVVDVEKRSFCVPVVSRGGHKCPARSR